MSELIEAFKIRGFEKVRNAADLGGRRIELIPGKVVFNISTIASEYVHCWLEVLGYSHAIMTKSYKQEHIGSLDSDEIIIFVHIDEIVDIVNKILSGYHFYQDDICTLLNIAKIPGKEQIEIWYDVQRYYAKDRYLTVIYDDAKEYDNTLNDIKRDLFSEFQIKDVDSFLQRLYGDIFCIDDNGNRLLKDDEPLTYAILLTEKK